MSLIRKGERIFPCKAGPGSGGARLRGPRRGAASPLQVPPAPARLFADDPAAPPPPPPRPPASPPLGIAWLSLAAASFLAGPVAGRCSGQWRLPLRSWGRRGARAWRGRRRETPAAVSAAGGGPREAAAAEEAGVEEAGEGRRRC